MAKQTFTTGQVLTAAQVNALQTNDFNQTVSAKTASYVLVAADKGTRIEFSTSGSVTCTVNTGLFDAGDTVYIQNTGAGVVTITAGTATVNTSATLAVNQYEGGVLYFVSASSAIWFEYASAATGDITGITTGATSGLTGGVTSGTADLKLNTTAKGGLLVGTGSGTASELAVGANNTVLTADSTTATGLKWATASSGSMTELASGSLSGASLDLTSISGSYNDLRLVVRNLLPATDGTTLRLRFNSDSNTRYNWNSVANNATFSNSYIEIQSYPIDNASSQGINIVNVYDYANANTWKFCDSRNFNNNSTTSTNVNIDAIYKGIYNQTSAITALNLFMSSGNFTSGTYILYGVK